MSPRSIRLGPRTLKTALSVMLCIILFQLLQRETPMIACLAAVFALRQSLSSTITFGSFRILGNCLGGACAIVYFFIYRAFDHHFAVELLVIPLLVIFIIVAADTFEFNAGIIGACATFFIIVLTVPETETMWYAVERIIDTILGTFVALSVNYVLKPPAVPAPSEAELVAQIQQTRADLAQLEKELNQLED